LDLLLGASELGRNLHADEAALSPEVGDLDGPITIIEGRVITTLLAIILRLRAFEDNLNHGLTTTHAESRVVCTAEGERESVLSLVLSDQVVQLGHSNRSVLGGDDVQERTSAGVSAGIHGSRDGVPLEENRRGQTEEEGEEDKM
jgi:hypothetical protein